MNFTNVSINLSGGYMPVEDCGSLLDYNVLQLCQSNALSNVIVFGGLWLCFLVVNVLHNFNKISDERYIRLMKTFVMAYVFLGTIALGSMIVTLL
jgi:hypothetical protein